MNKVFLYDKNSITYEDLLNYINFGIVKAPLSALEISILEQIKNLSEKNSSDITHLLEKIKLNNHRMTLRTSGTTSKPKNVTHTIETITKNIKVDLKYADVTWGMTYAIGKMAFYQVLFQALFNKSKIVILYGYSFHDLPERIIEHKITHLSATPTFFRMLTSSNKIFQDIQQVTLGGEGASNNFISKLKNYFPNARIKNVYASTETASIFASENDVFRIPERYKDKVKILNNKLHVHKDLVAEIDQTKIIDGWYDTQDVVELVTSNEFRFIGRENIELNVSGFKVNPYKVESIINALPYVVTSFVYSKKNSVVGHVLCCDIITKTETTKSIIKSDLKNWLEKHEMPFIINFVETISTNDNVKISRI